MDPKVRDFFIGRLDEIIKDHTDALAGNRCESFENYRYSCGVLAGLFQAKTTLNEILSSLDEEE